MLQTVACGHRQDQGHSSAIIVHFACVLIAAGVLAVSFTAYLLGVSKPTSVRQRLPASDTGVHPRGVHFAFVHYIHYIETCECYCCLPLQADRSSDQPHHAGRL